MYLSTLQVYINFEVSVTNCLVAIDRYKDKKHHKLVDYLKLKTRGLKAQPLKRLHSWKHSKYEQKIANAHPNTCTPSHTQPPIRPPSYPQTSKLGDYNKLNLRLSLIKVTV